MKKLTQKKIEEICEESELSSDTIEFFISEEWIIPADRDSGLFDEEDLARIRFIRELREDLGVNDDSISIILNLVDQLYYVRSQIEKINRSQNS